MQPARGWAADLRVGLRKWLFACAGLKNICLISRDYVAATVDGNKSREKYLTPYRYANCIFLFIVCRPRQNKNHAMRLCERDSLLLLQRLKNQICYTT